MKAFTVKDLMINLIPVKFGTGGSGMPGPDDDIDDFPPTITPVIMVAKATPRLQVVYQVAGNIKAGKIEHLNLEMLEEVAMDVGKSAVAGALFRTAYCTEDMPTCNANHIVSPLATLGTSLRFDDLVRVKVLLNEAVERIEELENSRLELARKQADEFIPGLEGAVKELRGSRKG